MSRPADWLGALGDHHRRGRAWHPHDQLLIVFEVEGAILGHGRTAIADQGLPDGGVVQQRQALVHRPQAAQCLLQPVAASVAPRANCFMGSLLPTPTAGNKHRHAPPVSSRPAWVRTVDDACAYYAKEFLDARRNQPTPYTEGLRFHMATATRPIATKRLLSDDDLERVAEEGRRS